MNENQLTIKSRNRNLHHRHTILKVLAITPIVSLLFMATPVVAHASIFGDIFDLNGWVCGILLGWSKGLFEGYSGFIAALGDSTGITGNFENLFSSTEIWGFVESVHQTVVIPLAESILALFMLVQLVKVSQRIDATSTLPAVKDIVFLAVTYVLFHWLIINSLDIITAIFNEFNKIANEFIPSATNPKPFEDIGEIKGEDMGGCFILLLCGAICWLTGLTATIVSTVVVMARAVQLYAMAAFSPIPLSLLGFDETRQMGIGFLKNFCAAALAGAVMLFLISAYPYMVTAASLSTSSLSAIAAGGYDGVAVIVDWIALGFLLIYALFKCGGWAKEILGG